MNASVHGGHFFFFMNSKQLIWVMILLIIALVVMTLPVWIDRAIPIMKNGINSAGKTMEDMQASLQYIWERLSVDITRLLDNYF
ncbi:MAG: hypothetical protein C3F06_12770 [Candidatus Methanoperedenaceae archaeon]|nr:MAG: hypothetical protein C3F06_12770 [Candidatus Methanoperedenaceae archaeon]